MGTHCPPVVKGCDTVRYLTGNVVRTGGNVLQMDKLLQVTMLHVLVHDEKGVGGGIPPVKRHKQVVALEEGG